MKHYLWKILIILPIAYSCSTAKYIYFREPKNPTTDSSFFQTKKTDYHIQPGDILYLEFKSSLSETTIYFDFTNKNSDNTSSIGGESSSMYLSQFVVDGQGDIMIPEIGYLKVSELTIPEINNLIQNEARKKIKDVIVKVKLVSFQITFLGEFGHPGEKVFYKDQVSLIDGLAAAGEVTYYGDRKHVRVMRQTPNGLYTYRLDLTDNSILNSEKFYLKPGDIVYAEPLSRKIFQMNAQDYSIFLSVLTSTLAFITLIITMQNNN
jgi:polysaccharide export outer membrane protein